MNYCDLKKGPLLGENEDEAVDEIQDSHIFKTNEYFLDARMEDGGQLLTTVRKLEEERNANFVISNEGEGGKNSYFVLSQDEEKHLNEIIVKGGTKRNDEHEVVIREIEYLIFPEDEIQPRIQHSKQFF